MNNVNEFKAAVAAGIAVLTALLWGVRLAGCAVGGSCDYGTSAGLLYFCTGLASSHSDPSISARLLCEP